MRIVHLHTFIFIGLWLLPSFGMAQKKQTTKAAKTSLRSTAITKDNQKVPLSQSLMQEYKFEEALVQLQKELATAKQQRKPLDQIEADIKFARKGASMLTGTERVTFIDSIVVDKENFLKAYRISPDAGRIGKLEDLFKDKEIPDERQGGTAYLNELEDNVIFSAPDKDGFLKIYSSMRLSNKWSNPQILKGLSNSKEEEQNYPFVLSDGVTLYYAAKGPESLGGYDIFVTRYNSETKSYVKAENIGMPFNSPANDYLLAIDEATGLGWFASDRSQPNGKVCIYVFIPNEVRDTYDVEKTDEESIRKAARIHSIAETWTNKKAVAQATQRLQEAGKVSVEKNRETQNILFVINDKTVYTQLTQFRNAQAKRIAGEWLRTQQQLESKQRRIDVLRKKYADGDGDTTLQSEEILNLEQEILHLRESSEKLAKNMRKAEIQ